MKGRDFHGWKTVVVAMLVLVSTLALEGPLAGTASASSFSASGSGNVTAATPATPSSSGSSDASGTLSLGGTLSWPLTPSDTPSLAPVACAAWGTGVTLSATYGGTSMTTAITYQYSSLYVGMFYLNDPASGTQTAIVTLQAAGGTTEVECSASGWTGTAGVDLTIASSTYEWGNSQTYLAISPAKAVPSNEVFFSALNRFEWSSGTTLSVAGTGASASIVDSNTNTGSGSGFGCQQAGSSDVDCIASAQLLSGGTSMQYSWLNYGAFAVAAGIGIETSTTWVVKGSTSNVWSGALDGLTSDWGDANLRLGFLADNFDDNTNEIWTETSGRSFSLSGGRAVLTATEVHASGSWTDLTLGATLGFASCGAADLLFRYGSSSSNYYLAVDFDGQQVTLYKVVGGTTTAVSPTLSVAMYANTNYDVKVLAQGAYAEIWWAGTRIWIGTDPSPPSPMLSGNVGLAETTRKCDLYVDNVRMRNPSGWSGNYTSIVRGAASGNAAAQVRFLGAADAYNSTDLWINSSADNRTWGGWHLVKAMAAPGVYYPVPDVDQEQYYQVRAVLRTGVDGTPAVSEIDVAEAAPSGTPAATNTGQAPWYLYVGGKVNAVSGNLFLASTDLSIQAKGEPIAITRTYNSLLASAPGPFGLGTMDEFHGKLALLAGGNVTLTASDGAAYTFVSLGGNAFSPPPGLHDNLVKNPDGTYTLLQPDGSKANFNAAGQLTSLVDRNGNHRTLTYANGNPTAIADDSGLSLTLTYDTSNRVTSITDPMGRTVRYEYDGSGRLQIFTDPMGFTESYTYDSVTNQLTQRVDRAGHVDRFVYDSSGRVDQVWVGEWNYTSGTIRWQVEAYAIAYTSGTETTVTNAAQTPTTLTFNSRGNPVSIVGPSVGCSLCSRGNSTRYTWDGEMDRLATVDGRGDTRTASYDWMGNPLASTDPGGNTTEQTFQYVHNATQ